MTEQELNLKAKLTLLLQSNIKTRSCYEPIPRIQWTIRWIGRCCWDILTLIQDQTETFLSSPDKKKLHFEVAVTERAVIVRMKLDSEIVFLCYENRAHRIYFHMTVSRTLKFLRHRTIYIYKTIFSNLRSHVPQKWQKHHLDELFKDTKNLTSMLLTEVCLFSVGWHATIRIIPRWFLNCYLLHYSAICCIYL